MHRHIVFLLVLGTRIARSAVFAALAVIVDNANPAIQYTGTWSPQAGLNTTDFFAGTIAFTNTSGVTATLSFTGYYASVYGAFVAPPGTYNMLSTYSIDGGAPTVFQPPSRIEAPMYNQLFFRSGTLPYGDHTIVVQNLGEQFWFDSIVYDVPDLTSSLQSKPTLQTTPATTPPASSSPDATHGTITDTSSQMPTPSISEQGPSFTLQTSPSSLTQSQGSSSIALSGHDSGLSAPTQTSVFPASNQAAPPALPVTSVSGADAPPSFTLSLPGGQTNGSITLDGQQHHKPAAGVIAGASIAGAVLLAFILLLTRFLWRRRQQRHITLDSGKIEPFGNDEDHCRGAVVLASKPGQSERLPVYSYTATSQVDSRIGTVSPPGTSATAYDNIRNDGVSEKHPIALPGLSLAPFTILSTNSPQISHEDAYRQEATLPSTEHDTPLRSPRTGVAERRRALDGGLRIAGGPPGEEESIPDDIFSIASTLPPSYEIYGR
ncbi:hypothetical protein BC628DRAFT_212889 [Trametes gibbosa]|nr:hypothetical protein BC628DRAFT_212889 [Trametes gibbosa]